MLHILEIRCISNEKLSISNEKPSILIENLEFRLKNPVFQIKKFNKADVILNWTKVFSN